MAKIKNIYKEYIFLKKPLKLQINTVASQYNDSDTHYHWFINSIATFLFEKNFFFRKKKFFFALDFMLHASIFLMMHTRLLG